MSGLTQLLLFAFGALVGSFINVLGSRYSDKDGCKLAVRGRSKCDYCKKLLKWYELVPVFSFLFLRRKCLKCKKKLSWQYPLVEILTGLVFVLVPLKLGQSIPSAIWLFAFLIFILISVIDLRLKIIPDKLTALVGILGVLLFVFYKTTGRFGLVDGTINGSFLGSYAVSFWLGNQNIFLNYAIGVSIGLLFFGSIYFLSKGKAMGFGDVKLATAIGLLLGWPDSFLAFVLAFITGSIYGSILILRKQKRAKDVIPFGPFIILGVILVFFFGYYILNGYFATFGLG